ncbi:MAG: elongation factor G [Candidatus Eiseniibacteriota bacterium]
MIRDLSRVRNIGISAHIDSGKTTLTERILFYTRRIHAMHEVRGKDGVGATMDSMELERERGITIASAATYCEWDGHHINIIDTPGHVDFTIEVERSLRVLDGAILVLCGVAGVQSQSISVDRQMRRYNVPRIAFINKCDRSGANPARVAQQLHDKLKHNAVLMQVPIGLEADHQGVVDLVEMRAATFEGEAGESIVWGEIPAAQRPEAEARREALLDTLSLHSDELTEAILEEAVTPELLHRAVREATLARKITPVFLGSAYKNKGVQLLMDAVVRYLPAPNEVANQATSLENGGAPVQLEADPSKPLVALAFKLVDSPYGQLTYLRLYQGRLRKGDTIHNARTQRRVKVSRLARLHADSMEDIDDAAGGDIVALFGIDCASGDTFIGDGINVTLGSMHVPDTVVSLAVKPRDKKAAGNMSKAIQRFMKEDPTFRSRQDQETGDTIVAGMGELHLDVYLERMRREYGVDLEVGAPQVAYRETITEAIDFDYTHRKQTGGSGQYGRVIGRLEPLTDRDFEFENKVTGGNIPTEYISSCEKGFRAALERGEHVGHRVTGVKVTLTDGAAHSVDSSDMAFQTAARDALRENYRRARPVALEPLMLVAVEGPSEFQGDMVVTLTQRRGMIIGATEDEGFVRVEAEVPLSTMFGYATTLRSATQGQAEFTMEFARYAPVPAEVDRELASAWAERRARGQ